MKRALERQEAGEARVVPILVRPMDWTGAPFAHLQALPTDAKPITSWRNKETALADVAAGLRHVIEELPLLPASPSRAALPSFWNVPYPRNPFFLGHEHELAQLRHSLQAGQATALSQPQAISGLGGIGKTQLALEYAYRYHQDYQVVLDAFGPQHPNTAETMHDLAQFWEKQGNSEDARAGYLRALAIRVQMLGARHPQTAKTCTYLIALLHRMGQHEEAAKLEATQAEI